MVLLLDSAAAVSAPAVRMTSAAVNGAAVRVDEREPPQNLQAERCVLGGLLISTSTLAAVRQTVGADDFYRVPHGDVFAAILAVYDRGDPVDYITVAAELDRAGKLVTVGGGPALIDFVTVTPVNARADAWADQVADAARRREILRAGQALIQSAHTAADDVDEVLARVRVRLDEADVRTKAGVVDLDSWSPVDLGPYLRGEVARVEPSVGLGRTDGLRLLYPGKEHMVIGEMEAGKSWYALGCAAVELLAGRHVVYVHFEEADPGDTLDRLRTLGVGVADILDRFRFVGPERPVTPAALAALLDPPPSLVVLDGVNEAMALHEQEIMGPDGSAAYRRRLVKPCTRVGAAVLSCDHVVKDPEKRGRGPMGSAHKGNGLSGSLIMLENADPFGRGARGRSRVFVTKDRPGHLRRRGRPTRTPGKTYIGELVVDDTQTVSPDLLLRLYAPRADEVDEDGEPTKAGQSSTDEMQREVLATVAKIAADGHEPNVRKIRAASTFRAAAVDGALERLVLAGALAESVGARNARVFTATVSQDQEVSHAS